MEKRTPTLAQSVSRALVFCYVQGRRRIGGLMDLQQKRRAPIARLKSAQATVGNMPTPPILSTAIPCSGHEEFPNAPSNTIRHARAIPLAACLTVSAYAFAKAPDDPQSAPASKPPS